MVDKFEILNEAKMDNALKALSNRLNVTERHYINRSGIEPFFKGLQTKVAIAARDYSQKGHYKKRDRIRDLAIYHPKKGTWENISSFVNAIDINATPEGGYVCGFTKKSKKAYIGRFLNDGWDVRNKYGNWGSAPGEHYFEKAEQETSHLIKIAEIEALKRVLRERGLKA